MWDSQPSRGIPMGMGIKLLKLMGKGREWERLLLMCFHLVIIFSPNSAFGPINL